MFHKYRLGFHIVTESILAGFHKPLFFNFSLIQESITNTPNNIGIPKKRPKTRTKSLFQKILKHLIVASSSKIINYTYMFFPYIFIYLDE